MTFLTFTLTAVLVCIIVYVATELLAYLAGDKIPPLIPRLLWIAAAVYIVLLLLQAVGLGGDVKMPKVG